MRSGGLRDEAWKAELASFEDAESSAVHSSLPMIRRSRRCTRRWPTSSVKRPTTLAAGLEHDDQRDARGRRFAASSIRSSFRPETDCCR